jgi:hypothetical protein
MGGVGDQARGGDSGHCQDDADDGDVETEVVVFKIGLELVTQFRRVDGVIDGGTGRCGRS